MTPLESKLKELKELCEFSPFNPIGRLTKLEEEGPKLIRALEVAIEGLKYHEAIEWDQVVYDGTATRSLKKIESILNQESEGESDEAEG